MWLHRRHRQKAALAAKAQRPYANPADVSTAEEGSDDFNEDIDIEYEDPIDALKRQFSVAEDPAVEVPFGFTKTLPARSDVDDTEVHIHFSDTDNSLASDVETSSKTKKKKRAMHLTEADMVKAGTMTPKPSPLAALPAEEEMDNWSFAQKSILFDPNNIASVADSPILHKKKKQKEEAFSSQPKPKQRMAIDTTATTDALDSAEVDEEQQFIVPPAAEEDFNGTATFDNTNHSAKHRPSELLLDADLFDALAVKPLSVSSEAYLRLARRTEELISQGSNTATFSGTASEVEVSSSVGSDVEGLVRSRQPAEDDFAELELDFDVDDEDDGFGEHIDENTAPSNMLDFSPTGSPSAPSLPNFRYINDGGDEEDPWGGARDLAPPSPAVAPTATASEGKRMAHPALTSLDLDAMREVVESRPTSKKQPMKFRAQKVTYKVAPRFKRVSLASPAFQTTRSPSKGESPNSSPKKFATARSRRQSTFAQRASLAGSLGRSGIVFSPPVQRTTRGANPVSALGMRPRQAHKPSANPSPTRLSLSQMQGASVLDPLDTSTHFVNITDGQQS